MKKRLIIVLLVVLSFAAVSAKAFVPPPLLPVIAEAIQAIVIRGAGRQAIAELSTAAANDATFAAAVTAVRGSQFAAWLGFGAVAAAYPVNLDTPVAPTLAKDQYAVAVGPIGQTNNYKPEFMSPGFEIQFNRAGENWKVYGKTREDAIAAYFKKASESSVFLGYYGRPLSWKVYNDTTPGVWEDMTRVYWDISVFTDKDGYRNENKWSSGVYVTIGHANAVEPRDGQRRILFDGKQFYADPEDPDWSLEEAKDFAKQTSFGFVAKGKANEPLRVGITADGTKIRLQEDVQVKTIDGKDQVVSRSLDIAPGTGQAIASATATQVGVTLETAPAEWIAGDTGTDNTGSGWPDDYARQPTLSSVDVGVGKISKTADEIKDILSKEKEVSDPLMPEMSDVVSQVTYFEQFKNLLAWRIPNVKAECPVLDYDQEISEFTFEVVIDSHCKLMTAEHQRMLDAIMIAVWTISALWIILGA